MTMCLCPMDVPFATAAHSPAAVPSLSSSRQPITRWPSFRSSISMTALGARFGLAASERVVVCPPSVDAAPRLADAPNVELTCSPMLLAQREVK